MSTSGLKFGDAQLGAIFFIRRAAVHGERRERRREQTPAANPIRPKSERRVKSIACRMTTPRFGATKHIRSTMI